MWGVVNADRAGQPPCPRPTSPDSRPGRLSLKLILLLLALVAVLPSLAGADGGGESVVAFTFPRGDLFDPQGVVVARLGPDIENPSWSPDGQQLAFTAGAVSRSAIHVINANGSARRRLTSPASGFDLAPEWSPDGTRIAFLRSRSSTHDLWVMNTDGSDQYPLATGVVGPAQHPQWSPDGRSIAYTPDGIETGILLVDARTASQRELTRFHGFVMGFSWSPDATQIAYARREVHDAGPSPATRIFVVNADGSGERPLVTAQQTPVVDAWSPAWSPDGRRVAYAGTHFGSGRALGSRGGSVYSSNLYVVDLADGIPHRLTRPPVDGVLKGPTVVGVAWWPDGRRLFFYREGTTLQQVNVDGSCEQPFSARMIMGDPAWRPGAMPNLPALGCSDLWALSPDGQETRPVGLGAPRRYVFEIWNSGTETAANSRLTVSASPPGCNSCRLHGVVVVGRSASCTEGPLPVRCELGSLEPGASARASVTLRISTATYANVHGTGSFAGSDGTTWNNTHSTAVYVMHCRHAGSASADRLVGTRRNDSFCGYLGDDRLDGGSGDDLLDGGSGSDTLIGRPGQDDLRGGEGADTIYARDGERDVIDCGHGPSTDTVQADPIDLIRPGCEQVMRRR